MSYTLFISDCHLDEDSPDRTKHFLHFMHDIAPYADELYILGDFFNGWLGDDDNSDFAQLIRKTLRTYSKLKPLHYILGNHDFLIGPKFVRDTGVRLYKKETIIRLYDEEILLLHGDQLMTLDHKFQNARKKMYSPFWQFIFNRAPLGYRRKRVQGWRKKSKSHTGAMPKEYLDVHVPTVESYFSEFKTKKMIHGHTHRPAIHEHIINDKQHERIVLNSWFKKPNYLKIDNESKVELIYLDI